MQSNNDISERAVVDLATRNTSAASESIDLIDCRSAMLSIAVGVGGITFDGTNKIEVRVTHSPDDVTYVPVAQADVIIDNSGSSWLIDATTGTVKQFITAKPAASTTRIDYVGPHRYLRVSIHFGGTHAVGTPTSVLLIRSRLRLWA